MAQAPVAVIDLGTNSTRLLVAELVDGEVRELDRRTTVTRLGQGVDAHGRLAGEAMERVYAALADYHSVIERHRPSRTVAFATSAVRDANNGAEFRVALQERFGLEARLLSGEEEARLGFLGATSGRGGRAGEPAETLVIDIGGGSTELVVGQPGAPPSFYVSTQLGSVRQTERHLEDDPPARDQLAQLTQEAAEIAAEKVPGNARRLVDTGIAVAGTPTSLAAIDQRLEPYDRRRVHGYRLPFRSVDAILAQLAGLPLEQRREVRGLHHDRAPTIVAGAAILLEIMRLFELEEVEVSEADILHGVALNLDLQARSGRMAG